MNQSNNTAAILAVMLGGLTAYLGFVMRKPPASSQRPVQELQPAPALVSEQFIPARLWQDPFDRAIERADPNDARTAPNYLRDQLEVRFANPPKTNGIRVLAILVEGGSYPEDAEVRRRLRYATQMALHACSYQPDDRNNLGVTILRWPMNSVVRDNYTQLLDCARRGLTSIGCSGQTSTNGILRLPFEWFSGSEHAINSPVLVLWLPEEQFADYPLRRLAFVLDTIFRQSASKIQGIAVIGPRSSNTLKAIAEDPVFAEFYTNQLGYLRHKVKIYSCQATVPDGELVRGAANSLKREAISTQITRNLLGTNATNPVFENRIATDDALAAQMVKELSNRGVYLRARDPDRPAVDRIALFYEADTIYGRSLMRQFRSEFASALHGVRRRPAGPPVHVTEIPYLRGLDGGKPLRSNSSPAARSDEPFSPTVERSDGDQQTDYAERVAMSLDELGDSGWGESIGKVRAVGLLGSDVYDKLVLLQVLRKKFPDVLYFTTDLDARLLHKDQQSWARNLLVASSFPLEAQPGSRLSFRDLYQTALYRACLAALEVPCEVPEPSLFEVGRSSFVPLTPPNRRAQNRSWASAGYWSISPPCARGLHRPSSFQV